MLDKLMKSVLAYTRRWVDMQTNKWKSQNAQLTFDMMGDPASFDGEKESVSMSKSATQSTQPKSSKRKGSHKERSNQK